MAAGNTGAFSIASLLSDGEQSKTPRDGQNKGEEHASVSGIQVELENRELWEKFRAIGNEMILTKSGRRMFPALRFVLHGLDPIANYELMVGIEPIDLKRYRYCYQRSQWLENPTPEQDEKPTSNSSRIYVHPASPATGTYWMREAVSFEKMKLTNNWKDNGGHVVLLSMHRYRPRLYVVCTDTGEVEDLVFDETTFMAVTAYQNPQITKLKIEGNPFARGFRTFSSRLRDGKGTAAHRTASASHGSGEVGVNSWTRGYANYSYHFATHPFVSTHSACFTSLHPSLWLSGMSVPPPLLHIIDHSHCSVEPLVHSDEHSYSPSASPVRGTWLTGPDGLLQSAGPH